ncbi:MAG: RNA polymerase sigma-70 factor [Bacteroidales bacterium]|nr:RNA polymerase sigma-70 factor [Bacteroidales bacterium]MCF8336868.1 RNA polymerase sigma-70 factor [Bacteroidales bacterium]
MDDNGEYNKKDDAQLVMQLKRGEEKAFESLYYRYSEKLYYFALRYLNNAEDAEGIVQEIFLKVWIHRQNLDENQSFNSYLFTIARNTIFNLHRSRQYEKVYLNYARNMFKELHNRSMEDIEYADLLRHINDLLLQLPPKRRKIFVMSRKLGMSYKDIARELSLSEKTIETHIRLALRTLKSALFKA